VALAQQFGEGTGLKIAALIVAAGTGSRFGGAVPKQYEPLLGRPVLRWTIEHVRAVPAIDAIRVVINPAFRDLYENATAGLDLPPPIEGGATRQDSVRRGLEALAADPPEAVLIHDAARPLIDARVAAAVIDALARAPAAIPALPLADALQRADSEGRALGTLDRAGVWRAQTPQGFRFAPIFEAHRAAAGLDLSDDAAVAQRSGLAVQLVRGAEMTMKITQRSDQATVEALLAAKLGDVRTGSGFDVHRLGPGEGVTLCGVTIACPLALIGHSDADVALHAVTDAILGAIGAGDIGSHFPPSEAQWRGAPSRIFLEKAVALAQERGGVIAHIDLTIICEAPRIGPYREAMVKSLSEIAGLEPARISVKATTTEKLGFTGRGEGIAAQAVATVRLPWVAA
jgi:2-C-methyl-D-erythritol 4-phosphate cytidylyltransferase/2-C-methyl-D-erythritol 2,4-cyclodiphosphate synthase